MSCNSHPASSLHPDLSLVFVRLLLSAALPLLLSLADLFRTNPQKAMLVRPRPRRPHREIPPFYIRITLTETNWLFPPQSTIPIIYNPDIIDLPFGQHPPTESSPLDIFRLDGARMAAIYDILENAGEFVWAAFGCERSWRDDYIWGWECVVVEDDVHDGEGRGEDGWGEGKEGGGQKVVVYLKGVWGREDMPLLFRREEPPTVEKNHGRQLHDGSGEGEGENGNDGGDACEVEDEVKDEVGGEIECGVGDEVEGEVEGEREEAGVESTKEILA